MQETEVKECITRQIHSDGKKRRSFLALHFAAGDLRRYLLEKSYFFGSAQIEHSSWYYW